MSGRNILLIWDIDGTLIRTNGIGGRAMSAAMLELYGIENGFAGINMAGMLDPVIVLHALSRHGIDKIDIPRFYKKYIEILSLEISSMKGSIAIPGVPELFDILVNYNGIYNVLGTGNIEQAARLKLSVDNLNRFFPTGGFPFEEKERWQVIKKAVENSANHFNVNFSAKDIYVIGDTPKDIEGGKKLGLRTIGVSSGSHTPAELQSCCADYVLESLSDTSAFLKIIIPGIKD